MIVHRMTKNERLPDTSYAHSVAGHSEAEWETLADHARTVADFAGEFAAPFGWAGAARVAGLLHDAGKASAEFQAYLKGQHGGVDHSTFGARLAGHLYSRAGHILAPCIAGHHAGLPDGPELERRLAPEYRIPDAADWQRHIAAPPKETLVPARNLNGGTFGQTAFAQSFLIRMLFSCLVDADFLATEAFYAGTPVRQGEAGNLAALETRLICFIADLQANAKRNTLNSLRAEILSHALAKASEPPGFFTLTVPTGGGKTLTSLRFALAHARAHGLRRVIYVIPYTSIIEQTAEEFRRAVGAESVLEHHSAFDWEDAAHRVAAPDGGGGRDGLGALRRAAANWDAPVIVTTAVQFFESLFACRTSACRKLHNIVDSVVILDEAQTLPGPLLLPCLAVLDELQRNYRVSPVLCTATQPALRRQDGALRDKQGTLLGLDIDELRELAPRPRELHDMLRRVSVEIVREPVPDETIAARFVDAPRMLCIVNSRAHARALFGRIAALRGAAHLTTLMCPIHRRRRLAELRQRLKDGEPVRLVATSLVEAGVDISFPEVWRALAGVDAIAQAGGRCNREGELLPALGRVVVFRPVEERIPRTFQPMRQAAESVLRDHAADPLSLDALRAYFAQLYFQKGIEALDAKQIGDLPGRGVLAALQATARNLRFPFRSIAEAFRLIDEVMVPVVVPYDADAEQALEAVASPGPPSRDALRQLRQFTVGVPRAARDAWLASGDIRPVRQDMGEALLRFVDRSHYHEETGVELTDPMQRAAENNIW